ncbi:MAG: hypothetical protein QW506_04650 [Thermoproteota archaeon]
MYDNGYIRIYRSGEEVFEAPLEDQQTLKLKLIEIAKANGLKDSEAVARIDEFFGFCRQLTARLSTVDLGDGRVRYADGTYVRQVYVSSDEAYMSVYLYGEHELREGVRVIGVRPAWLMSSNRLVKMAKTVPAFVPSEIITLELKLIRNVVLDVNEFIELMKEVEHINRCEAEHPSFAEVWIDVEAALSTEMKIDKIDLYKAVSYVIACWFYDFLPTYPELAIVGPPGSGKTELRDRIAMLTRTIPLTQGSSLPAMRRVINTMFPGIAFDEKLLSDPDTQSFLRASYRKGSFIILADRENPNKVYSYDPYGPRILTCLPQDYVRLREDTLGRHIAINMVRSRVPGRVELSREKFWPIVKKLYLLMLYRWREFIDAWRSIDAILSRYLAGHTRDIAPTVLTPVFLADEERFKVLYEALMEEYRLKQDLDEKLSYLIEGIMRYAVSQLPLNGTNTIWITPKKIVELNEGIYDERSREHKSWVRRLGRMLKATPKPLPFVKKFSRKEDCNYHLIDLEEFFKYVQAYNFTLSEELAKDEKIKRLLEAYSVNLDSEVFVTYEEVIKLFRVSSSGKIPETPTEQTERIISQKEAQNELLSEGSESSSFSEDKPESSWAGISGVFTKKDALNSFSVLEKGLQAPSTPQRLKNPEVIGEPISGGICEFCGRKPATKVIRDAVGIQRYICERCLEEVMEED